MFNTFFGWLNIFIYFFWECVDAQSCFQLYDVCLFSRSSYTYVKEIKYNMGIVSCNICVQLATAISESDDDVENCNVQIFLF